MNAPNAPKRNWDGIGWVVLASAAGGLLSWLYSLVLKQPLCDSVLLSLTCSILFGIVAGGTGVYVFKLVDQSVFARTFFIAVVFGFVWKPVIEAIPAYVKKTTLAFVETNAKEIAAKTEETSQQLKPQGNSETLKSQIKTTSDDAVKAVATLPDVKSSSETHRVVSDSAVTAVAALGEVAIKNNDLAVKKQATEALSKVGSAALSTQSYGVANAVSKSLENVVNTSKDPEIKGRAWDIKQKIDALNAPATATSVPP
jgi:hypothetical protein